ncbi:MAG: S8 family serine peptidase [Faecousia sp.]
MKKSFRRLLAWALCLALVLSALPAMAVGATDTSVTAAADRSKMVYATGEATTFVPAGYTYVYEGANGQVYSRQAQQDVYISSRVLTAQEAEALANLEYGQEGYMVDSTGRTLVCREFDAREAAAMSSAVQVILAGEDVAEDAKVSVLSEPCTSRTPVRALITFEDAPVIGLKGMSVSLGKPLGNAELQASRTIESKQLTVLSRAEKSLGCDIQVNNQFSLLTNAVSVTVNYGDLAALSKVSGVKSAILMPSYSIPEINAVTVDGDVETNLKYAAPGMGANYAWDAGYKGEGMSVAVIDTGLCFENPSFAIEPSDTDAVAFTKEDIASILATKELNAETLSEDTSIDTVYYSSKIPFGFNYGDSEANFGSDDNTWFGHGSHVAGIVAGNLPEDAKEEFGMDTMGVAPEAQLIIMKVFDMMGNCYFDYLIAAIEDAILLGVDCANLSLGAPSGPVYLEDVTDVYDKAYEAGINVVVSAGNDAHAGVGSFWGNDLVKSDSVTTGTVGMPGSFDNVLTVASAENSKQISFWGNAISWYNQKLNMRQFVSYEELPDVPEGKGFKESLEGSTYGFTDSFDDAEGKLVFYPFDGGNADSVIAAAVKAKAAGVILTGPQPTEENGWSFVEATVTRFDVPVCVSDVGQYEWMLMQGPADGVVQVDAQWNPSATAGQISDFSSWGPTDGLTLKPEITGIGGNVFSAYYGTYFAIASGTSMSSPAVAASAALVRQYLAEENVQHDIPTNQLVNSLLMSTATPVFDEENGTYYFVRRQGAGLANIGAALSSLAYIDVEGCDKPKFELGDDPARTGTYEMTFEVVNLSDTAKTYTLNTSVLGQRAEGGQFRNGKVTYLTTDSPRALNPVVTTSLTDGTVTVPAKGKAQVTVTVALTDAEKAYYDERFPAGAYVEGFIQLLSDETPNLTVPFLGFYGDFDDAPILEEGSYETLLGGIHSYTTADQLHNSLVGYVTGGDGPEDLFSVKQHYLGDTRNPESVKIAQRDYDYESMWTWATEFYSEQAGISPNGDKNLDAFNLAIALRRNADNVHYTVTNIDTGEILWEQDTGFMQKTFNAGYYAGAELSVEWLYPLVTEEYDWGTWTYYDTSTTLVPNNTWVEITADVTPEGAEKATESISFTLYIDQDAPISGDGFTVSCEQESFFPDEPPFTMYQFRKEYSEQWFMDYGMDMSLEYNEETGQWEGFGFGSTWGGSATPIKGDGGWSQTGTSNFGSNSIMICMDYDHAGNASVFEVRGGDGMLEYVDLQADKTEIQVGETLTVLDVAENDFNTILNWAVSDESVAEIVESDAHSVTIKGLKKGTVTVSGGIGEYMAGVEITVVDPAFEAIKSQFTDIQNHWAKEDIAEAVYRGLFNGIDEDTFAPDKPITRGQLVTVLYRMEGEPEGAAKSSFADVKDGAYYAEAVNWAAENGIVNGIDEDTFAPNRPVTREQFAAILYRYAEYKELDVTARADLSAFKDADKVSSYAKDALSWAVAEGLIKGVSSTTLAPKGSATRAQAAVLLVRFQDTFN